MMSKLLVAAATTALAAAGAQGACLSDMQAAALTANARAPR
jgi:hypothetical protein